MRTATRMIASLAIFAPLLVACGGSGSAANGMPACTTELITAAAEASWAGNPDQENEVLGVTCADDWALATINFVDTNAEDVAANGGEAPASEGTLLFHYDGTAWGPNAGNDVCGTADMSTDPPAYPSDAQVPESIWQAACWAN